MWTSILQNVAKLQMWKLVVDFSTMESDQWSQSSLAVLTFDAVVIVFRYGCALYLLSFSIGLFMHLGEKYHDFLWQRQKQAHKSPTSNVRNQGRVEINAMINTVI